MNIRSEHIEQLIYLTKFVSSKQIWDEEQFLFQQLDEFLLECFQTLPHFVFSHSTDSKGKAIKRKVRSVWNRELTKDIVNTSDIFNEIRAIVKTNQLDKFHIIKKKDLNFYIFNYGINENQLYWGVIPTPNLLNTDKNILNYLIKYLRNTYKCIQDLKAVKHISSLAFIDDITGFYNHRKLNEDINELVNRYEKIDEALAVLFIDIDHFKDVNDGFGHLIGTQLLTDFADRLRYLVRETDFIYRYGGDEFVVILTNTKYIRVKEIAERVLSGIKDKTFKLDSGKCYPLSISIGIARYPEDAKSGKEIINIADELMYTAKKQGRGRVCLTEDYKKER